MMLEGIRYNAPSRSGEIIRRTARFVTHDQIMTMIELWRAGKDTADIAREIGLPEHEVANRLPAIREQFRSVGVR